MGRSTTVEPAPAVEASSISTAKPATTPATESAVITVPATAIEPRPTAIKSAATVIAVAAMEPRARSNENTACKVIGAIIPVRCAGIRRIAVVAIRADGGRPNIIWPNVTWPDSDSYSKPNLRVGSARHNHAKPEQNRVF